MYPLPPFTKGKNSRRGIYGLTDPSISSMNTSFRFIRLSGQEEKFHLEQLEKTTTSSIVLALVKVRESDHLIDIIHLHHPMTLDHMQLDINIHHNFLLLPWDISITYYPTYPYPSGQYPYPPSPPLSTPLKEIFLWADGSTWLWHIRLQLRRK